MVTSLLLAATLAAAPAPQSVDGFKLTIVSNLGIYIATLDGAVVSTTGSPGPTLRYHVQGTETSEIDQPNDIVFQDSFESDDDNWDYHVWLPNGVLYALGDHCTLLYETPVSVALLCYW